MSIKNVVSNCKKPVLSLVVGLGLVLGASTSASAATIVGELDDTSGVALFSAGQGINDPSHNPGNPAAICDGAAGASPTDDIVLTAIGAGVLEFIGDIPAEVVSFNIGSDIEVPNPTYIDAATMAEVNEGLTTIDDFGDISNGGDDAANFDMGSGGDVTLQLDGKAIFPDGVISTGTLIDTGTPFTNLDGYEIFIFEDGELSGMDITLTGPTQSLTINIDDFQVNPNTMTGADDTLITIDLDSLAGWTDPFVYDVKISDLASSWDPLTSCFISAFVDVSLELDAVATRSDVTGPIPPSLVISKSAGDAAPGEVFSLSAPGDVEFTYVVTNTSVVDFVGTNALENVEINDDAGEPSDPSKHVVITAAECPGLALIQPQTSVTCTATINVPFGVTNIAEATGNPVNASGQDIQGVSSPLAEASATVDIPVTPGISIEKFTNGEDSDEAPGQVLSVGDSVNWTYSVTNTGNTALGPIPVTDDQAVAVDCGDGTNVISILLPGQSADCTGSGVAIDGQYTNVGAAIGSPIMPDPSSCGCDVSDYTTWPTDLGQYLPAITLTGESIPEVSANDPSNYFGEPILAVTGAEDRSIALSGLLLALIGFTLISFSKIRFASSWLKS